VFLTWLLGVNLDSGLGKIRRLTVRLGWPPTAKAQLEVFEVLFEVGITLTISSDAISREEMNPIFLSTITLTIMAT
jgi:hypothetical protein